MKKSVLITLVLSLVILNVNAQDLSNPASNTQTPKVAILPDGGSLAIKLLNFQDNQVNNKTFLQWTVAANEITNQFEVEKSIDGSDFHMAGLVFGSEKSGVENYAFPLSASGEKVYYRLKMITKSGVATYSKTYTYQMNEVSDNGIKALVSR